MSTKLKMLTISGEDEVARAESVYAIPGTYTWVCPVGVTSVSVVCVGGGGAGFNDPSRNGGCGGGLAYKNNISVTPGTSYTVVVGRGGHGVTSDEGSGQDGTSSYFDSTSTVCATGGSAADGANGGTWTAGDGGGTGGNANDGGGGAAGYSGDGGSGSSSSSGATSGTGGGGGGGNYYSGGGGVGYFGEGSSGGTKSSDGGYGGSGGYAGEKGGSGQDGDGGLFGGGGGSGTSSNDGGSGGHGVVRIVWPGDTRQFPSTDVNTPY